MDNIGGAEVVDLILARELKADIYTTNIDRVKIARMGFSTDNIFSIGRIPINPPWKQELAYWKFRRLKLKAKYDFYIIAGDWAMSGAVLNHPNLWYVYSPMREIWDLYQYTREHNVPRSWRPLFDFWVMFRRMINRCDLRQVDKLASVSANVQSRVKKYLGRDSPVIYPPVEIEKYHYQNNGDYWLSVNRLINHKRVEIQLEAFSWLPEEKLVIVGSYEKSRHFQQYAAQIRKMKPPNVEIRSWIGQDELINLYAGCRGFVTTSYEEDFGLTAVEAMASGKPVIAPNEGGYKETVINGKTGLLLDDINGEKLAVAVRTVSTNPEKYRQACLEQAKKFDVSVFIGRIKQEIGL